MYNIDVYLDGEIVRTWYNIEGYKVIFNKDSGTMDLYALIKGVWVFVMHEYGDWSYEIKEA